MSVTTTTTSTLHRIGAGFCGSVWAEDPEANPTVAIKREDGGPGRSLYNDYQMHLRVINSFSSGHSQIQVPGCHRYVQKDDEAWWEEQISEFPQNFQLPCNALVSDRIPPFSKVVRENIINAYCPKTLRSCIMASKPDQDCLIRPYLGRRRRLVRSNFHPFSLRNYPLHLDQFADLGLNSRTYARLMAEALATLYWRAHIDANDVEFVLAPPLPESNVGSNQRVPLANIIKSDMLGEHVMWILDFDCCRHMQPDELGVEQAVTAFLRNDPFYPRPAHKGEDGKLWTDFKTYFLEISENMLGRDSSESHLPMLLVKRIEQRLCK